MKDRTIANFLAGSFGLAFLGALVSAENQNLLFVVAGVGLLTFGIMAAFRLRKYDNKDWLPIAVFTSIGLTIFSEILINKIPDTVGLIFWVFGVWAIIRLYRLSKTN